MVYVAQSKTGQVLIFPKNPQSQLYLSKDYKISCLCEKVYIGDIGRNLSTQLK